MQKYYIEASRTRKMTINGNSLPLGYAARADYAPGDTLSEYMDTYTIDPDFHKARALVMEYGWNSSAYQILNKGMKLWFSSSKQAVVGYQDYGNYRIVAGAPVCALADITCVIEEFEIAASGATKHPCYFCAGTRLASVLAGENAGHSLILGAEPVWNPNDWDAITMSKPSLRAQVSRATNKGVSVRRWDNSIAAAHLLIQQCLTEWLMSRGLPPLHFLIESQTLDRLYDRRVYVAEMDGVPVGFAVLSPIANRNGWLVEQNIRSASAPNGTIELLLNYAARDVAALGADFFTLGLSPLSCHFTEESQHSLWLSGLLYWLRAHGTRFYNFEGLDSFKSKFQPEYWEPIYVISSSRKINLGMLYAIAGAFAAMSPIKLGWLAVYRAITGRVHFSE